MLAWGIAPGLMAPKSASAESVIHSTIRFNPRHNARRNQQRSCAAARGVLPETCECDGALVVPRRIAARHRVESGGMRSQRERRTQADRGKLRAFRWRNVIGRAFPGIADDILPRARTSVPIRFALQRGD